MAVSAVLDTRAGTRSTRLAAVWPFGALLVLNVVAGALTLGGKSLWLDEAVSARYAHLSLSGLWHVVSHSDPNMGLYYSALNLWAHAAGYTEFALRSLSVLVGCIAVPVIGLLASRVSGARCGLIAALLLALCPFFIRYEQTARSYALVVTLVTVSSYLFVREMEEPSARTWLGYVLASALAVYAHYFACLVIAVQFLTVLAVRRRGAFNRSWIGAGAAIVVLSIPEAIFASRAGPTGISWIKPPTPLDIVELPGQLIGWAPLAILLIALACYGIFNGLRGPADWKLGFMIAWLFVPVLLVLAASELGRPTFLPYYLIIVLPPYLILAARGAAKIPAPRWQHAAIGALAVLGLTGAVHLYLQPAVNDYRGATGYLVDHTAGGDEVAYFPTRAWAGVGYYSTLDRYRSPATARLPSLGPQNQCVWALIRDSDDPPATVERRITPTRPQLRAVTSFNGITLVLFGPRRGAPAPAACG